MDSIYDYVMWTGEYSFETMPFCELDAVVLVQLAYYNYSRFIGGETALSLRKTYETTMNELKSKSKDGHVESPFGSGFFEAVIKSVRFGSLVPCGYVEKLDSNISMQFSAVTFIYNDKFRFLSFRGTDDSLAGWKEDCMMSFTRVAAQEMALEYAKRNIDPAVKNYIGGHSKGANLALYVSANLKFDVWDSVEQVYLLDGPGLCKDVFDVSNIDKVDRRATRIIPEFSVIGKLFEPDIRNTVIVKSDEKGFAQHSLFSWGVEYGKLKEAEENDPQSEKISGLLNSWIGDISRRERKAFINELFDAAEDNGFTTLSDITDGGADSLERLLMNFAGSSSSARHAAASLPERAIFGSVFINIKKSGLYRWFEKCTVAKSILLIALGVFFIFSTSKVLETTAMMFFISLAVAEFIVVIRRFYQAKWDFSKIKERIYLLVILVAVCTVVIIKEDALFLIGSFIYGIFSIIIGFRQISRAREMKKDIFLRTLYVSEAVLLFVFGMVFLIIPYSTIYAFSVSVGTLLVIDGLTRLIYRIYREFRPNEGNKHSR